MYINYDFNIFVNMFNVINIRKYEMNIIFFKDIIIIMFGYKCFVKYYILIF